MLGESPTIANEMKAGGLLRSGHTHTRAHTCTHARAHTRTHARVRTHTHTLTHLWYTSVYLCEANVCQYTEFWAIPF
jgi:hypothetical protein